MSEEGGGREREKEGAAYPFFPTVGRSASRPWAPSVRPLDRARQTDRVRDPPWTHSLSLSSSIHVGLGRKAGRAFLPRAQMQWARGGLKSVGGWMDDRDFDLEMLLAGCSYGALVLMMYATPSYDEKMSIESHCARVQVESLLLARAHITQHVRHRHFPSQQLFEQAAAPFCLDGVCVFCAVGNCPLASFSRPLRA